MTMKIAIGIRSSLKGLKQRLISRHRSEMYNKKEYAIKAILFVVTLTTIFTLSAVFFFIFSEALPAFDEIGVIEFITGPVWNPTSPTNPAYGILPLLCGTFLVSLGASVIAIPIGIGCTIYLAEIAHPKIRSLLKPAIEILAGIPSVVYGFFALVILSDWIYAIFHNTYRLNALNGAIMLAVMMIPIMVSLAEDAMNSVPKELREAAYALGATRWETLKGIIIPASLSGITAAIMLSIGRAVGETMTVLMACGNTPIITWDMLSSVETMTAAIAIEMGEINFGSLHYHALFAVGAVLFVITFAINFVADLVLSKFTEVYH
ncbi:MAG: phosphate ABC transporter permease subunit PstC [Methanomassiliicoccales archaeon]|nr:phosphate ABC transporter permease subunit PstC [Methanomassiliicoccales archaeon]